MREFRIGRIAINRHDDGISLTLGGSVHTYQARWRDRAGIYTDHLGGRVLAAHVLQLTKSERNNW